MSNNSRCICHGLLYTEDVMKLPSQLGRLGLVVGMVISCGVLHGCVIQPLPKISFGRDQKLEPAEWTVEGIAIDDTHGQVAERFGTPSYISPNFSAPGQLKKGYSSGEEGFNEGRLTVTYDKTGKVIEVIGRSLMRDGEVVLVSQDPEGSIEYTLGKGFRKGHTRPKGGLTGYVFSYATHRFHSDNAEFIIWVNDERRIGSITARHLEED